jgi:hypothetical protein
MGILTTDGEVSPQNSIYFRSDTGAIDTARGKTICQAVYNWYGSEIMPLLSSEVTLFHVIGIDMTGSPHLSSDSEPLADVIGGSTAALPLVLALRVDFLSGLTGRWYNGRNYLAGIPESKCVKSHIDADWAESVRIAYEGLLSVASGLGCTWVVVSRSFAGVPRSEAIATPITAVVIPDLRVRTWRQRIARYGT